MEELVEVLRQHGILGVETKGFSQVGASFLGMVEDLGLVGGLDHLGCFMLQHDLLGRLVLLIVGIELDGASQIGCGSLEISALEFLRGVAKNGLSPHAIIQGGQGFGLGRPSHDLSPQSPAILHDRRLALHGTQA